MFTSRMLSSRAVNAMSKVVSAASKGNLRSVVSRSKQSMQIHSIAGPMMMRTSANIIQKGPTPCGALMMMQSCISETNSAKKEGRSLRRGLNVSLCIGDAEDDDG